MPKQIKIGFDKGVSRESDSDQILVDVRGNLLEDSQGGYLYTETTLAPSNFFAAKNAMPIYINNEPSNEVSLGKSIAIVEQFSEISEVSSSLLGIPRLGKQQSLLADVSVYGLDDNTWEFYTNPQPYSPTEWINRLNKKYGNRSDPKLKEYSNEQALALEVFPTPWTFPFGPKWDDQGRYVAKDFEQYIKFITLGNELYEYYAIKNKLKSFAENNFLVPGRATVVGNDVIYDSDFNLALENVEQWTMTWMDIRDGRLEDPLREGKLLDSVQINVLFNNSDSLDFKFDVTQPGYSSNAYRYCQLQSKEAFRYQPGAISGFTFGVRLNADESTLTNAVEWGCANNTDQFMFQVKGSQLNIVRRSTIPLSAQNLALMKLTLEDLKTIQPPNPYERNNTSYNTEDLGLLPVPETPMYEVVIQSDYFNGDPLDGSGASQYNIAFSDVTMYKIEYSWYGAIGAKFYAYIPVGNAEARWVLLHTLIIENTLDSPSLQNPYMHFRYSIYQNSTSSLREPMYLYKYGASYYIDGTDSGTYAYNSYKISTEKIISSVSSVPVLGFLPKESILNKDGIATKNQKNFYIEEASITSNKNIRVDVLECEGCPGGHGHFYATSLQNGQSGEIDEFTITPNGRLQYTDPFKVFSTFIGEKKIIAPGIYNSYIAYPNTNNNTSTTALIKRRLGSISTNTPIDSFGYNAIDQSYINNTPSGLLNYTFTGRITGYNDIIASDTAITKPFIKVQFLNPISVDNLGQWNEFIIGLTTKKPTLDIPIGGDTIKLLFDGDPLDLYTEIYGEFTSFQPRKDIQGVEVGEGDIRVGDIMEQDFRIAPPKGDSSGKCSELNFEIGNTIIGRDTDPTGPAVNDAVTYSAVDPSGSLPPGSHFIIFNSEPTIQSLKDSEIGIFSINKYVQSNIFFTTDAVRFTDPNTLDIKYIAGITGNISTLSDITLYGIALRTVKCYSRFINKIKTIPFGAKKFYIFAAMRDNARINNIVVKEYDEYSSFSHTPFWIKDNTSNITILDLGNPEPPSNVTDKLTTSNEYIGTDGLYYMGGVPFKGNIPSNFLEKKRLDSVQYDSQLNLPLRPAALKTSIYIGANTSESLKMSHIFGVDRYKLTKGAFNNKSLYFSTAVTDQGTSGTVYINISGKEQ